MPNPLILDAVTSILGGIAKPENIDSLIKNGFIEKLIDKIDANTVKTICITIIAASSSDEGTKQAAIIQINGGGEIKELSK